MQLSRIQPKKREREERACVWSIVIISWCTDCHIGKLIGHIEMNLSNAAARIDLGNTADKVSVFVRPRGTINQRLLNSGRVLD